MLNARNLDALLLYGRCIIYRNAMLSYNAEEEPQNETILYKIIKIRIRHISGIKSQEYRARCATSVNL